jgi:hypothetical protein
VVLFVIVACVTIVPDAYEAVTGETVTRPAGASNEVVKPAAEAWVGATLPVSMAVSAKMLKIREENLMGK